MRTIIAVLISATVFAASAAGMTNPPTEGPHNCKVLEALGDKPVCEGESQIPTPPPAPVTTTPTEIVTVPSATYTESDHVTICFPTQSWNADNNARPCDTIKRPYEDGSTRLTLGTYGAPVARCVIPNPTEERHQFVIHCHRVSH